MVRTAALAAVRFSGAAWVARHTVQFRRVSVLAYHDPDPATFERHMTVLASLYNVITLGALLDALQHSDFRRLPRRPLLITLDDGWAGNSRLLPVFARHRVRPTIFLTTSIVGTNRHFWWTCVPDLHRRERLKSLSTRQRLDELAKAGYSREAEYPQREALSLEEIAGMAPFVDFGAHTRSHPILPNDPATDAEREILGSATDVQRLTGIGARAFAYPNGDFTSREVDLVRSSGCEAAFTVEAGYVTARSDPYRLRRIFVDEDAGVTELIAGASGVYSIAVCLVRRVLGSRL